MLAIDLSAYIYQFPILFPELKGTLPWEITSVISSFISEKIAQLNSDFSIHNTIAVHKEALVEEGVIMKGPVIISAGCFVAAHSYLRGGVWLGEKVIIGPGCEIKSSFVLGHSSLAHFNYAGDSILGAHVNMEAGSVIANHYNERKDKMIFVQSGGTSAATGVYKFGALIGDHCKIGANAVLSPGTMLVRESIVNRLTLVEQNGGF